MRVDWFEPPVLGWSPRVSWAPAELRRAAQLLCCISAANSGNVAHDVELSDNEARRFALDRAQDALQRRVNDYAARLRGPEAPKYREAAETGKGVSLPFLAHQRWHPAIDVNTAPVQHLAAIDGIGRKAAKRIVAHRQRHGPFATLADLSAVEGIDGHILDAIRDRVSFAEKSLPDFMSPALAKFIQAPSFGQYVELIATMRGSYSRGDQIDASLTAQVIRELEATLQDVQAHPYGTGRNLSLTRASVVRALQQRQDQATKVATHSVTTVGAGTILHNQDYRAFVWHLMAAAMRSIYLCAFFLRYEDYEDRPRYPTYDLMQELLAAHTKGRDVRVILDQDAEGERYRSRLVNQRAYDALLAHQVPVRFDRTHPYKHARVLVVDSTHVVVGSHNWTAGSLLNDDDTSLYLESAELARQLEAQILTLWSE